MAIVDITSTTDKAVEMPLPFQEVAHEILDKEYVVSLVFIDNEYSRHLNKTYRHKDAPTNVLSFPLEKTSGEIFINADYSGEEAALYNKTPEQYILYLFIHGCLHLKGLSHGSTMDAEEKRLSEAFGC